MKFTLSRTRRAFTLIELLIVITIMSLLAAILLPVFGRACENARRSSCGSNMKQFGLGLMQYVQDCDEKYPAYFVGSKLWRQLIRPYSKSPQEMVCPCNKNREVVASASIPSEGIPEVNVSYAVACSQASNSGAGDDRFGINASGYGVMSCTFAGIGGAPSTVLDLFQRR